MAITLGEMEYAVRGFVSRKFHIPRKDENEPKPVCDGSTKYDWVYAHKENYGGDLSKWGELCKKCVKVKRGEINPFKELVVKDYTPRTEAGKDVAAAGADQKELMAFDLQEDGLTDSEISEIMNLSKSTIANYRRRAREKYQMQQYGRIIY